MNLINNIRESFHPLALSNSLALAQLDKETNSLFEMFSKTKKTLSAQTYDPVEAKLQTLEHNLSVLSLRKLSTEEESELTILGRKINVLYRALNTAKHLSHSNTTSLEKHEDPRVIRKKLLSLKKAIGFKNPSTSYLLTSLSSLESSLRRSSLSSREIEKIKSHLHELLKEVVQVANTKSTKVQALPYFKEGLKNLGNTCYMNASFAFLQKSGLAEALPLPKKIKIFKANAPSPVKLKNALGNLDPDFKSSRQQDAMEAISLILNQVNFSKKRKGFLEKILDLFLSIFSSEKTSETPFSSFKTTYHWDVSSLPKDLQKEAAASSRSSIDPIHTIGLPENNKDVPLQDLLKNYFIDSDTSSMDPNPFEDSAKKQTYLRKAKSIQRSFVEPPKHLVLSFNRFTNGRKLDNSVLGLHEHLNLSGKYFETGLDMHYERSAAIIHRGTTTSGHYYAVVKGPDGKYYKFDDEKVSVISRRHADEEFKKAYIVHYKG